jgi:hypothetical protein
MFAEENTTGPGGLSGSPLTQIAIAQHRQAHLRVNNQYILHGLMIVSDLVAMGI